MARLERGKGKRQTIIELSQHGLMLRTRENAGGDLRLPGYRRCASVEAAHAALEAEVRRLIDDGMRPGDDAARAIADAMPRSAADLPPTLPVRRDLDIYNEATGFVVTSRRMAGKTLEEGSDEWKKAVAKGDLIPLTLVQDDPFVIRVVAGEPLSAQEEEEWIARVDGHLNISDGRLCVTGGSVFSNEDYDEGNPYYEGYVGEVLLPKGRYRARLYTHAHGVNGGAVMDGIAGGAYGSGEPLGAWWARTRGAETQPAYDDDTDLVGFLLHLEPIGKAPPKKELSELPEGGWFGGAENARKPERCPCGLVGVNVQRRQREENTGWSYVRDVGELLGESAVKALRGGPLALPVTELSLVARIAWFASRLALFEVRLTNPAGLGDLASYDWPEGIIGVEENRVGRLLMSADVHPAESVPLLVVAAAIIATLPSGTKVELLSAALSMSDEPGEEAKMRTSGVVRDGSWSITGVWPLVDAATLGAAIALARDTSEPTDAIALFAKRFGGTWPVVKLGDDESDDESDDLFPTEPIKGAQIWVAPNGRNYLQTMALLLSEDVASTAQARERALVARGYRHVGDLLCDAYANVAVRGYAKPGGTMWGFLHCAAPDTVIVQLVSLYEGGGMLVTSPDPKAADQPEKRVYKTGMQGANTLDLLNSHEPRAAELVATLGALRTTDRSMLGFAQALDLVVDATN